MSSGGLSPFKNSNPGQFTGRVFYYNQLMELFIAATSLVGLTTIIVAIDESIDWMASYFREGEEDHEYRAKQTLTYEQFSEQGYRE